MNYRTRMQQAAILALSSGVKIDPRKLAHELARCYRDEFLEWAAQRAEPISVRMLEEFLRGGVTTSGLEGQMEFPDLVKEIMAAAPIDIVLGVPIKELGVVEYSAVPYLTSDELLLVADKLNEAMDAFGLKRQQILAHVEYRRAKGVPDNVPLLVRPEKTPPHPRLNQPDTDPDPSFYGYGDDRNN